MGRFIGSASLFCLIFVSGFALMGFEMLGSRYLNPYFGSGITTWACLISVVLFAMMVGYTVGGIVADRSRDLRILAGVLCLVGVYLILVAFLANGVMNGIMLSVGYGFWGTMLAAVCLTFLPVALLAALSPFFVRVLLTELRYGGRITGAVYGVSTMGNVIGTLVTVFLFIPTFGTSRITIVFGCILVACGVVSFVAARPMSARFGTVAGLILCALLVFPNALGSTETVRRLSAFYPEGPVWLDDRLYAAEMTADRVSILGEDGLSPFWRRTGCGPTAVVKFTEHLLAISCHLSGRIVLVSRAGRAVREITEIAGRPLRSPNDLHASGAGYLFVSDPGLFENSHRNLGNVYFYSSEPVSEALVVEDLQYPNGVAFEKSTRTLYVSEHLGRRVWSFKLNETLDILKRVPVMRTDHLFGDIEPEPLSGPDGLRLGDNGTMFVAIYGAGRVVVRKPGGEIRRWTMPFKYVTAIALHRTAIAVTGAYDNRKFPYHGEILLIRRGS